MLRSLLARLRRARRALAKAAQYACEPLEQRQLLSNIVWVNRGNDGFGAFGTQANVARGVVDAAIARWERVISNFNYAGGAPNVFALTVEVTSNVGNGAVTYNGDDIDGKPDAATIKIDAGSDGAGGKYFFDPTPMDDWEFQGNNGNAFCARAISPSAALYKYDFLTLVTHEMGHALGITSNGSLLFRNLSHDTGVADTVDNAGGIGDYWAFVGPSVQHLFTGFNSNGPTDGTDSGGPTHSAPAGAQVSYGGQTYKGVADLMTAYYSASARCTIPDTMALALKDAYGYTVTLPQTFGTFYANFDSTTGELLVQGGNTVDGSNDNINVYRSGSDIVVSVDIGNDVPGTGAKPGSGSLPAFVSRFPAASVTSIDIEGNDGDDIIGLGDLYANIPVTINGGSGDDSIYLNGPDISGIEGKVYVSGGGGGGGGAGNDTLSVTDSSSYNHTYTLNPGIIIRDGVPTISYDWISNLYLRNGTGPSVVTLRGNASTTTHIIGTTGGNIVNITANGYTSGITSPVYITNPNDFTTLNVDDSVDTYATHPYVQDTMLGGLSPYDIYYNSTDLASLNITTGKAADTVAVLDAKFPVNITTTDGADFVTIGNNGSLADILKTVTVDNLHNYTSLTIDDSADTTAHLGILSANALTFLSTGAIHWDQNDLNSLTILGGSGGNTFTISSMPFNEYFVSTELTSGGGSDTLNVQQTNSVLNIHGKSGHDTVNLGDSNGVQDLHGELNIDDASNYTTINVNDTGNTAGRSVTISNAAVTGLCPADINYHGSDLWALNVTGGSAADSFTIASTATNGWTPITTVTGGLANDIFNVQGATGPLVINGGGGLDSANIGNAGDLQGIAGAVSISDPPANSYISVNIDDSADASADAGTLTATALSGLSPGTISWSAANLNSLSINGGSGGNKFTITDTPYNTQSASLAVPSR